MKKLFDTKKEQTYVVHPGRTLHVDEEENFYWTFVFHPDIVYLQDADDNWYLF